MAPGDLSAAPVPKRAPSSSSLNRSAGVRMPAAPAGSSQSESLSAHPLLATSPPNAYTTNGAGPHRAEADSLVPPGGVGGYSVKYKTRQRPTSWVGEGDDGSHHARRASASSTASSLRSSFTSTSTVAAEAPTPVGSLTASSPTTSVSKPVLPPSTTSAPGTTTIITPPGSSSYSFLSHVGVNIGGSATSVGQTTGGATEALLFQNLRGDAQALGLDGESLGWAIITSISGHSVATGSSLSAPGSAASTTAEWETLRRVLDGGGVTLLLPKTRLDDNQVVTPELVLDHCVIGDLGRGGNDAKNRGGATEEKRVTTLGGWRGVLEGDRMVIASAGKGLDLASKDAPPVASIYPSVSPPISLGDELTAPAALRFPIFTVPASASTKLTIPRVRPVSQTSQSSHGSKGGRGAPGGASTTARLASLFSNRGSESSTPIPTSSSSSSINEIASPPAIDPPAASPFGGPAAGRDSNPPWSIPVCTVDRPLDPVELATGVRTALAARLRSTLDDDSVGSEAVDKVCEFAARFVPSDQEASQHRGVKTVPRSPTGSPHLGSLSLHGVKTSHSTTEEESEPLYLASPETIADAVQALYEEVADLVEKDVTEKLELAAAQEDDESLSRSRRGLTAGEDDGAQEGRQSEKVQVEEEVNKALEVVEEVLCGELHDVLFSPVQGPDTEADDWIASRIAGLNLLDLSLDHLGLDLERRETDDPETVRKIRAGLDELVEATSAELAKLQEPECRSPKDKLAVFVTLHKLIVDRLGSLPPIPMKEDPSEDPKPARPPNADVEMTDAVKAPASPRSSSERQGSSSASTTSSADIILPLLIYSIVRSNPPRLISHVCFTQRFRAQGLVLGEAAYCLVNIDAVCEFVRNVDASNLGADRVMAPEDPSITGRLRRSTGASSTPGREKLAVEVEDAFVAASRVVTGVFGGTQKMLTRAMDQPAPFMGNDASTGKPRTLEDVKNVLSGQAKDAGASFARARVELLKRATSVQSGSLTTMGRDRSKSEVPSSNARELQEVKHTGSPEQPGREGEGRSLRSFFNREERSASDSGDRPSFSDRLSGLPGLSRLNDRSAKAAKDPPKVNPPQAGRVLIADPSERTEQSPLLTAIAGNRSRRIPPQLPVGEDPEATPTATSAPRLGDGPPSLPPRTSSSKQRKLDPPISTLLECDAEDLRLKDIAVLLADYRRLASACHSAGLFAEK